MKKKIRVIVDYRPEKSCPFLTLEGVKYQYARPVLPEEAPAIIGEDND